MDAVTTEAIKPEVQVEEPAPVAAEPEAPPAATEQPDDGKRTFYVGGALKALKAGEIEGLLVAFGNPQQRDAHGEYFTPHTNYELKRYANWPVLFHHELDPQVKGQEVGRITEIIPTDAGLLARAELYVESPDPHIRRAASGIYDKVKRGELGWSSGSVPHWVDVTPDGEIKRWPIVEGSLTPTPAEPQRTTVYALKSACNSLLCDVDIEPEGRQEADSAVRETPKATIRPQHSIKQRKRGKTMAVKMDASAIIAAGREAGLSDEQIISMIENMGIEAPELPEENTPDPMMAQEEVVRSAPAKAQPAALTTEQVQKLIADALKSAPAPQPALSGQQAEKKQEPRVQVSSKYDNLDWEDLAFMRTMLDASARNRGGRWTPENGEAFWRAFAEKTEKANHKFDAPATKALRAIKNDEVNYSTLASFGDEFVPDLWNSQLWMTPRIENPVWRNMVTIDMPSNPYNLPIESTDPTVYAVAETKHESALGINDSSAAIPDTQVGTTNTTLTAGKLALRISISAELVEDSIIPIATQWRKQSVRAMEDARDYVLLNGDATTGTSNINNSGGSISSTHKSLYGGGDGLLHLPLVTTTANLTDNGGGAPTLSKIRTNRATLDTQILADFGNLAYFCDPLTSVALSSVDELLDASINGRDSTVMTGAVGTIDTIPVYVTNQMSLALGTTGFVSSTAASNTTGRLLLVHLPSWYVGFRRQVSVNYAFLPDVDAWSLVVSMRIAIARRTADVSSCLFNIAV